MDRPLLRAGSAFLAFGALLLGMALIAFPAQQRLGMTGIWVTEALAIALPAVIALLLAGVRLGPFLGLRSIKPRHALVAVAAAALNQPIVSVITWAAHEGLPAQWVQAFDDKQRGIELIFRGHELSMLLAVVIAAPIGEELFFRGFAFPALRRSFGTLAAAVVSGIFFSAIHGDPVAFAGLMEIGILCAVLRHWSGSLWAAVLAHAVNNSFAGGAFLLGWEDPTVPPPPWVLASGAILLLAYLVLFVRVLRKPSPLEAEEIRLAGGRQWSRAAPAVAIWVLGLAVGGGAFVRDLLRASGRG